MILALGAVFMSCEKNDPQPENTKVTTTDTVYVTSDPVTTTDTVYVTVEPEKTAAEIEADRLIYVKDNYIQLLSQGIDIEYNDSLGADYRINTGNQLQYIEVVEINGQFRNLPIYIIFYNSNNTIISGSRIYYTSDGEVAYREEYYY